MQGVVGVELLFVATPLRGTLWLVSGASMALNGREIVSTPRCFTLHGETASAYVNGFPFSLSLTLSLSFLSHVSFPLTLEIFTQSRFFLFHADSITFSYYLFFNCHLFAKSISINLSKSVFCFTCLDLCICFWVFLSFYKSRYSPGRYTKYLRINKLSRISWFEWMNKWMNERMN